jgi:ribosomal protein S18 acetylase RimI-like enzyme
MGTRHASGARLVDEVDAATMRRLLEHEARVHSMPGRELRDLGDAILLHDPVEPEPFWNRLEAIRWPEDPDGFDRRLTEALVLFTAIGRQPHIWPAPVHDAPVDVVDRLKANGFEDMGAGCVMVMTDPEPARAGAERRYGRTVTLERLGRDSLAGSATVLADVVSVLCDAFRVEDERRPGVEAETAASLANEAFTHYLARIDGQPAAVARRATFDGASYLSSIGTAVWARGRGLGELVTMAAAADALEADSEWIYLGVFADNDVAIRLYERAGFVMLGEPAPDLLLLG